MLYRYCLRNCSSAGRPFSVENSMAYRFADYLKNDCKCVLRIEGVGLYQKVAYFFADAGNVKRFVKNRIDICMLFFFQS